MKNILIILILIFSVGLSEASEIQQILISTDSDKLTKLKKWSQDKTKEELVIELYRLSMEQERRRKVVELKNEAILERERLKLENEKAKLGRMREEIELRARQHNYCSCQEQPIAK